ncbi:MAG TPA: signal peptide peptidase SppA [Candidatus Nanoarchaeia archaeon]|nr:signal peptide peptidase SppA [Candidatus Nanoarchaeia archaeon]
MARVSASLNQQDKQFQGNQRTPFRIMLIVIGGLLLLSVLISAVISFFIAEESGNVAVIKVEGVIQGTNNDFWDGIAYSPDIISLIEKADKSSEVKAIIIEINSPGGSAVASDEIGQALKRTNKTAVAVIREVGASGGYWVASAADHVIANRMAITGSIGVIGSYLEFSGLIKDYNVSYERLVAGERKDIGTPFRKMTDDERALMQGVLDEIHEQFINEVAVNRNLTVEEVRKIADGMFLTGAQAQKAGLVDELGGIEEAKAFIERELNITVETVEYEHEESLADLLSSVLSRASFSVGDGIGSALTRQSGSVSVRA